MLLHLWWGLHLESSNQCDMIAPGLAFTFTCITKRSVKAPEFVKPRLLLRLALLGTVNIGLHLLLHQKHVKQHTRPHYINVFLTTAVIRPCKPLQPECSTRTGSAILLGPDRTKLYPKKVHAQFFFCIVMLHVMSPIQST